MDNEVRSRGFEPASHVRDSLREDAVDRDVTTRMLPEPTTVIQANVLSRDEGVIAGMELFQLAFKCLPDVSEPLSSEPVKCQLHCEDGVEVTSNRTLATLSGPADRILPAERVALNYLQQLSGVATRTREMVNRSEPYDVEIYDTRKTVPHHRDLQKYAVRCGGGNNHRHSLAEAVMIKDNHKQTAGGLENVLKSLETDLPVIVEIHDRDEFQTVVDSMEEYPDHFDIDIIMLDNFEPDAIEGILEDSPPGLTVELSGGVQLNNLDSYCRTGADRISVGALTHSFDSLDLSLKLSP